MAEHHAKVLIIGTGAAGCTAAIYAARANLAPLVVAGLQPGGQLTITTDVENYPGFADGIQGPDLMQAMQQQAENCGAKLQYDTITHIDFSQRPFRCQGDSGDVYVGDTLIISTGASARWLGLESEQKFSGFGVSACATCDGFFYRGKDVAVVGGGNTAVEEALYLANICKSVTLVHRRDSLRAEKILQDRLMKAANIHIVWDSVVDEILGDEDPLNVTGVRVKNVHDGRTQDLNVAGVFIAIGHTPNTSLFEGHLDMDADKYLITKPDSTATNIAGVYAAGDVQDKTYRQAITAAGTGCMAALEAERFLATHAAS
jgi:thioredoxin reductase (NADPH)